MQLRRGQEVAGRACEVLCSQQGFANEIRRTIVCFMAVEVHVTGRVHVGRFGDFVKASRQWLQLRAARDSAPCRLLYALSGEMNTVRMVFVYPDLNSYVREETRDAADPEYAHVASEMPFVEGTVSIEVFRDAADQTDG
jgi:hypothetical protein